MGAQEKIEARVKVSFHRRFHFHVIQNQPKRYSTGLKALQMLDFKLLRILPIT